MNIPKEIKFLKDAIRTKNEYYKLKLFSNNKKQDFKIDDEVCCLVAKESCTLNGKMGYNFKVIKGRIESIVDDNTISIKTFLFGSQEILNSFKTHCVIV